MLTITAGKVPGAVRQILVAEGSNVLQTMGIAARECGFTFSATPYSANGREMVDVPFLNGRELATREGDKIVAVLWDTPVSNGDIILLVPKIKGNQFLVTVGRVPGSIGQYALCESTAPEAQPGDGTVANALYLAGLTLAENECVEVNGQLVGLDHILHDGDSVIVKQVPALVSAPVPAPAAELLERISALEARVAVLEAKNASRKKISAKKAKAPARKKGGKRKK